MKSRKITLLVLTVIFLAAAAFLSWNVYKNGNEFKKQRTEQARVLDSKQRLTDWKEWLSDKFDLGNLFDRSNVEKGAEAEGEARVFYTEAVFHAWLLAGISVLYFLITLFIYRGTTFLCRYLSFSLIIVSFVFLAVGVSVPMMEIGFFSDMLNIPIEFDVPYIDKHVDLSTKFQGRMYFLYHNKSILDLIYVLFSNNNLLVGTAILLFSLIMPILKLGLSLYQFLAPKDKSKFIGFVVQNLGKWSMADVFVVAIFLGYFSFQNMSTGVESETYPLVGLWFFVSFVIISIISSMLLKHSVKKQKDTIIIN
ncbi:MAG TPA: paraquat-inducible protein A [Flavobacteriales bacterium]|nr:paraquat-inducible protein A [Flavobacteriales bacterium]